VYRIFGMNFMGEERTKERERERERDRDRETPRDT
jgi:hypothetical protein